MNQAEAKAAIDGVIETLRPLVAKIESGPQMTKNHYSHYMAILSQATDIDSRKKLAACLVKAGANIEGIADALKLL